MEPEKKKSKWYNMKFNKEWLNDPNFKDLLLVHGKDDPNASYCKYCNFKMKNANRSSLNKHQNSNKPRTNIESAKYSVSIAQFLSKPSQTESEQVEKSDLLLAGYFAEHNVPFVHADHFSDLCRRAFPDSQIAAKIAMKKTKMWYVIQDGIAFHEKLTLDEICRTQKFSILIDETTDICYSDISNSSALF